MENGTRIDNVIDVWKATVEVQKHFNDIEIRIRSIAVGGLGVLLSATALAYREGLAAKLGDLTIPVSVFILVAALVFWISLYAMDRLWYHRLLMGAILHGQAIEEKYSDVLPELSLTRSIGKQSPVAFAGNVLHSKNKMDIFYGVGALSIVLFALVLSIATPDSLNRRNVAADEEQPISVTIKQVPGSTTLKPVDDDERVEPAETDSFDPSNPQAE